MNKRTRIDKESDFCYLSRFGKVKESYYYLYNHSSNYKLKYETVTFYL